MEKTENTTELSKELAKTISEIGLKVTPQRVAVMKALYTLNHPKAEDIFKVVIEDLPGLSFSTVYNTLDTLVKKEVIKKIHSEKGIMRYDAVAHKHHHIYCIQSDQVDDYVDPELDSLLEEYFKKKKIKGFKLKEVKLQLMGEFERPTL